MPANRHGSLVILADRGVLITGPSGAGKTALALALVSHCTSCGRFARLVADDQVLLTAAGGRLVGRAPPAIGGLAEARGLGPAPVRYEKAAVIDLIVRLVSAPAAPRYQEGATARLKGVELACLELAEHDTAAAVLAVTARLSLPPFGLIR